MKILGKASIGSLGLKNRMVMAPMTRSRADTEGIINDLAAVYYAQRAGAGLIVSEAINISTQGIGMPNTPGLYSQSQIQAWQKVTAAVHAAGGLIFAQLNHAGRVAHSLNRMGRLPVAPSAIAIANQQVYTPEGQKDFEVPDALSTQQVRAVIGDFRQAALNAVAAGFDGVELHAALGYLPNQFLAESSNKRSDEYGGPVENRARFILEAVREMVAAIGSDRVGIKLSPSVPINGISESDPLGVYSYLIQELDKQDIAYFHLMQPLFPLEGLPQYPNDVVGSLGKLTTKNIIANGSYTRKSAENELSRGNAQFVSFGSLFLANPDLPERFRLDAPLNAPDRATMYAGGDAKGYTDYPALPK